MIDVGEKDLVWRIGSSDSKKVSLWRSKNMRDFKLKSLSAITRLEKAQEA